METKMTVCEHRCIVTEEALANPDGRHYLDCPIAIEARRRMGLKEGPVWPYTIQPAPEGSRKQKRAAKRFFKLLRKAS